MLELTTDQFLMLLLIILISQIVMIFTDMGIAFTIPPYMVEKRFWKRLPEVSEKMWKLVKPKFDEAIGEINNKINSLCTNEIPHAIDERMEIVERNIDSKILDLKQEIFMNLEQTSANIQVSINAMDELKSQLARTLGYAGQAGRSQKEAERLYLEKSIIEQDPSKKNMLLGLRLARGKAITSKQHDMALAYLSGGLEGMIGGLPIGQSTTQGLPMVRGNAPQENGSQEMLQSLPAKNGANEEQMETSRLPGDEGIKEAVSRLQVEQMLSQKLPKKVVKEIMAAGDANLKKKEVN